MNSTLFRKYLNRIYPEEEVARLRFIKRAKNHGFTLNEIKEWLFISHNPNATKADVKDRTLARKRNTREN